MLTRRRFLVASGTALAALSLRAEGADSVPTNLDHILLGCRDLDQGIAFVESHTGVRAGFGGVHPGRGTQNALLSLGERHYLEIIAPDPEQEMTQNRVRGAGPDLVTELKSLADPRLVGWAAHPGSLADFAKKLRAAGIAFHGPTPGSRKRPDGRLLQWQTLNLDNDDSGLLPFFIEWAADSPHPASDAPQGSRLVRFELVIPDPEALTKTVALMSLDATVTKGAKPQIRASIAGPKGELNLTS
jgi:catechol 2,3-dioxygenase-like lactoylglutathione lyase family enzyme